MVASAKQLAALKKGRATRARNLAAKKSKPAKRKLTKKKVARKAPAKRCTNPAPKKRKVAPKKYLIEMVWAGTKAYFVGKDKIDTVKSKAILYTKAGAEKKAREIFKGFRSNPALDSVAVVKK